MTERRRLASVAAGAALAGALAVAGCSSGSSRGTATSTTARRAGLPPSDQASLKAVVAPLLAPFGDDVQRVEVETNPTPDHHVMLSLYARPRDARTPDQYATGLAPLAKAVVPTLLARYPGLYAVDLCQEAQHPPADVAEPPPLTRVYVTRPRSAAVHWDRLDLSAIRRQAHGRNPSIEIYVDPIVAGSATFRAAKPPT
jgi:hypothetical protein